MTHAERHRPLTLRLLTLLALAAALLWVGHKPHPESNGESPAGGNAGHVCMLCSMGSAAQQAPCLATLGQIVPVVEAALVPASWAPPAPLLLHPAIAPRSPPAGA